MNNFRKVADFDYQPLLTEIAATPLWNWLSLRQHAGHGDDIVLRYQSVQAPHVAQDFFTDITCVDYFVQEYFPFTMALVQAVFNRPLGRIVIAKLKPSESIQPHVDEGYYSNNTDRYHLVVATNPEVQMTSGDETLHMKRGEIWWFNNHITHSVTNAGTTNRLHIIVDTLK